MSAFNTVRAQAECSSCHEVVEQRIQFKYGDCWQHEYDLGDRLDWGGNDVGKPGARRVKVHGSSEQCPNCQYLGIDYTVAIDHDIISAVGPAPDGPFPMTTGHLYVVEDD